MGKSKEKGAVLVGAAVAMPLLLVMFAAAFELSHFLDCHIRLSQIAYEGARYGAGLPLLEEGSSTTTNNPSMPTHTRLQDRVVLLLQFQSTQIQAASIRTTYTSPTGVKSVQVQLEMPYQPIFPIAESLRVVRAQATAPYLLDQST